MKDEEKRIVDQFGKVLNISIAFSELDADQKLPTLCMLVDSTAESLKVTPLDVLKEIVPAVLFVNEAMGNKGVVSNE